MSDRERIPAPAHDPLADAFGSTGLFLMVTAVVAFPVCVASLLHAQGALAAVVGVIALLSFAVGTFCFSADGRRSRQRQPLVAAQQGRLSSES
ncbi:MAG: hypothetical protein QOE41_1615 [Mycobacterium sp.]|nr:hypothetical protein [Mycobacterium sp.]MDT5132304.1 hypothetical protein [Mycobacterium sp.]